MNVHRRFMTKFNLEVKRIELHVVTTALLLDIVQATVNKHTSTIQIPTFCIQVEAIQTF